MKKKTVIILTIFLIAFSTLTVGFAEDSDVEKWLLGTYRGYYRGSEGFQGATIKIYKSDIDEYEASVDFYPVLKNPSGLSGKFICSVEYDYSESVVKLKGKEWIKRPGDLTILDFDLKLYETILKGEAIGKMETKYIFKMNKELDDEKPSSWAIKKVDKAIKEGYVPVDLQEKYKENITRKEFSKMLISAMTITFDRTIDSFLMENDLAIEKNKFLDTDDYYVLAANAMGVVKGYDNGNFGPNDPITRQQAATMLKRLAKNYDITSTYEIERDFQDSKNISNYAKSAVQFVSTAKLESFDAPVMSGDGNKFFPKRHYTRQEAIITLYRLLSYIESKK